MRDGIQRDTPNNKELYICDNHFWQLAAPQKDQIKVFFQLCSIYFHMYHVFWLNNEFNSISLHKTLTLTLTNAFHSQDSKDFSFSCLLSIRPKQHEISMATNGGLSVYIVSLETRSFILHCTKLNILCPLVYNVNFNIFSSNLVWQNCPCGYGMSHTRQQNHV